jgi:hypothetical protein
VSVDINEMACFTCTFSPVCPFGRGCA